MTSAHASEPQLLGLDVLAAVDAIFRREGVDAGARCLLERGLSAEAYRDAKAHWAARIQAEKEVGGSALVVAYAAAYRRALEKKHRHDPAPAAEPARAVQSSPPSAPPPGAAPREIPTYLAAQPALVAPAPAIAVVEVRRGDARADPLDGTLELQGATIATSDPLPFVASESSLLAAPPAAVQAAAEARARAPRGLASTVAIDPEQRAAAAVLPFGGAAAKAPEPAPDLTLNQYASLCAELRVGGRRAPKILAAYHLADDAALEQLHRGWARRLDAEPGLRERFDDLSIKYAAWLSRR